jgi:hypothetical protein
MQGSAWSPNSGARWQWQPPAGQFNNQTFHHSNPPITLENGLPVIQQSFPAQHFARKVQTPLYGPNMLVLGIPAGAVEAPFVLESWPSPYFTRRVQQPADPRNLTIQMPVAQDPFAPVSFPQPTTPRSTQVTNPPDLLGTTLPGPILGTQFDFPNPTRRLYQQPPFIGPVLLGLTLPGPILGEQFDFPNPTRRPYYQQPFEVPNLFSALLPGPILGQQFDWPQPVWPKTQTPFVLPNLLTSTLATPPAQDPFIPTSWAQFSRAIQPQAWFAPNLLTSTLSEAPIVAPFVPVQFPQITPRLTQPPQITPDLLGTTLPGPTLGLVLDFPNPVRLPVVQRPFETPNLLHSTLPGPILGEQFDWPRPVWSRPVQIQLIPNLLSSTLTPVVGVPFVPVQFPQVISARSVPAFLPINLLQTTLAQPQAVPFAPIAFTQTFPRIVQQPFIPTTPLGTTLPGPILGYPVNWALHFPRPTQPPTVLPNLLFSTLNPKPFTPRFFVPVLFRPSQVYYAPQVTNYLALGFPADIFGGLTVQAQLEARARVEALQAFAAVGSITTPVLVEALQSLVVVESIDAPVRVEALESEVRSDVLEG